MTSSLGRPGSLPPVVRRCLASLLLLGGLCGRSLAADPADRERFEMAVELLVEGDPDMRAVAAETLRDGLPGNEYSKELAERILPAVSADVQPMLLSMLAERGDPAALPGILELLATTSSDAVRTAAIAALGTLGGAAELPAILAALDEPATRAAARRAVVAMQGPAIATALRHLAADEAAPLGQRLAAVGILADRRDREAVATLGDLAAGTIPQLRSAAMQALAKLATPADLPTMITGLLAAAPGRERDDAERAIVTVCGTPAERDQAATQLAARYQRSSPTERAVLLPLLGRLGGPAALAIIEPLLTAADRPTRLAALTALARWPDASVVPQARGLLATIDAERAEQPQRQQDRPQERQQEQERQREQEQERNILLAMLIRIAPVPGNGLDDAGRLALVEETMGFCTTDADRRRLLERAAAIRTIETLRFLAVHLDRPPLAEAAARGVVALAHHRGLRDAHKAEFTAALDRVLAIATDPVTRDRAERYKQGKTWKRR